MEKNTRYWQKYDLIGDHTMSFLTNSWTIGISASLISGIVLLLFTIWISNRKSNKEHLLNISTANKQIKDILKLHIVNNNLPDIETVNVIISTVARKSELLESDLLSIKDFCHELIYEITENAYIAIDKKTEYTEKLKNYIMTTSSITNTNDFTNICEICRRNYKMKTIEKIGIYLGVFATFMTTSLYIYSSIDYDNNINMLRVPLFTLIIVILIIVAGILFSLPIINDFLSRIKKIYKD